MGTQVAIHNQCGAKPKRWDRTGVVLEVKDFDQYVVKVDGFGRLTVRNRKFLKPLVVDKGMHNTSKCNYYPPKPNRVETDISLGPGLESKYDLSTDRPSLEASESDLNKGLLSHSLPPSLSSPVSNGDHLPDVPIPENINEDSGRVLGDANEVVGDTEECAAPSLDVEQSKDIPQKSPRRSSRFKLPKKFYDPASGTYVVPTSYEVYTSINLVGM